jgi:hypothetical protein
VIGSLLAALALATVVAATARRRRTRRLHPAPARVGELHDRTTTDAHGAVRSVQAAELTLPPDALEQLWRPMQLERLARTYWRYLSHVTLRLVRVDYSAEQRTVVLLRQPFRLLRFRAPEYAMDEERGIVRWRIEGGLLVQRGHHGHGYLQIDVRRLPPLAPDRARICVEVEVANFYPSIAHRLSRPVYGITQSKIHVLVTHGFLRSLARLDLATSRVGRWTAELGVDDVPDPPLPDAAASGLARREVERGLRARGRMPRGGDYP